MPAPIFTENETNSRILEGMACTCTELHDLFKNDFYTEKEQILKYLSELADVLNAQAFVVSLRDAPQT